MQNNGIFFGLSCLLAVSYENSKSRLQSYNIFHIKSHNYRYENLLIIDNIIDNKVVLMINLYDIVNSTIIKFVVNITLLYENHLYKSFKLYWNILKYYI